MTTDIDRLRVKMEGYFSVRDDCIRRHEQKLLEAQGELKTALEFDEKAVKLMMQISWLEERS